MMTDVGVNLKICRLFTIMGSIDMAIDFINVKSFVVL
jgi:hypothetical protein